MSLTLDQRSQYERFPYPPISFFALPRTDQGIPLKYENAGAYLGQAISSEGIRVLVIGGGTLEPLVVAMANPRASEIINVDLSQRSIEILERRSQLFSLAHPFTRRAMVKNRRGDFAELSLGLFDYVIASNVLHHTADPAQALKQASDALRPGGILRLVTYPKGSRYWMRKTSKWLYSQGVDQSPDPKRAAMLALQKLPITNPIRTTFESHPERKTQTGLIDAFFNACENPLSPLEWQTASENAGLALIAEAQNEDSRSTVVDHVASGLSTWEKLQIMDDTWELCANPILWFQKRYGLPFRTESRQLPLPHSQMERADVLLRKGGSSLAQWREWLTKEVGPRVWPGNPAEIMRGLSITEYSVDELIRDY